MCVLESHLGPLKEPPLQPPGCTWTVNELSIVIVDGLYSWESASWAYNQHPTFCSGTWICSYGVLPPFLYLGRNGEMWIFPLCYLYKLIQHNFNIIQGVYIPHVRHGYSKHQWLCKLMWFICSLTCLVFRDQCKCIVGQILWLLQIESRTLGNTMFNFNGQ